MKQQTAGTVHAEASRSALVLRDLEGILDQLAGNRAAGETGPSEKETNLRILREKVTRSLQRSQEQLRNLDEEIAVLTQFCRAEGIAPLVDAQDLKEDDAQATYMQEIQNGLQAGLCAQPGGVIAD